VEAGSDAILTNTFSANPQNLRSGQIEKVIRAGVRIARKAAGNKPVIGDIGPLGVLISPYGDGDFTQTRKVYASICRAFCSESIEVLCLETFTSMIEAKAAFLAAREFSKVIIVSFSLQDNGRTIMGEIPESIAITFERLGAACVGFNCAHPDVVLEAVRRISGIASIPILAKPNAGRVRIRGGKVEHTLSDKELASYFDGLAGAGASMIGGCCGTTSEYIKMIAKRPKRPAPRRVMKAFFLASPSSVLQVESSDRCIVGERLNPSGRKKLKGSLLDGDYAVYGEEARAQEKAGAAALDVNAFVAGLDEEKALMGCVHEVLRNVRLPLFIDTQNIEAARAVMEIYPGIGVYNSVPARVKELKKWLPLVRKFGFKAVVSLVSAAIPRDHGERMKNARLAMDTARSIGFSLDDLIFDPLVFSAATEAEQVAETLKTVVALQGLGFKTILGISNVSFGLPERSALNSVFAASAVRAGASFLIVNPIDAAVTGAVRAANALFGRSISGYVQHFKKNQHKITAGQPALGGDQKIKKTMTLLQAVVSGNPVLSRELSCEYLKKRRLTPYELIEDHIARGLKLVGADYEKGKLFIPDLLRSAQAARAALDVVKKQMKQGSKKGRIVLATVRGDIHDIGKNIAAMIFEAGGYEVHDLGKNVPAYRIVEAVRKYKPDAVGLSALLTTTMPEMEKVIIDLRHAGQKTKVIIGGPNVSAAYARKIGAFGAAKNVVEGLNIVERIRNKSAEG
jgi:5-methyltetrahydrofolate--homocysteine methyltransferase